MKKAIEQLKLGAVIAYPTETYWGLGADVYNKTAVGKIFDLKKRDASKAISVLVRDIDMAKDLAEISKNVEDLMYVLWPGPVTFVLPKKDTVPEGIHRNTGFVGLRNSSHPWCQSLFNDYQGPITTTSINISGDRPVTLASELKGFSKDIYVVSNNESPNGNAQSSSDSEFENNSLGSTVIKVSGGTVKILRAGDVSAEIINQATSSCQLKNI